MKPPTGTKYGSSPLARQRFLKSRFAFARAFGSECVNIPPHIAPWPCAVMHPLYGPFGSLILSTVGLIAAPIARIDGRHDGSASRRAVPLARARADEPQ